MADKSGVLKYSKLDQAGVVFSGACIVHCALTPLIALFSPVISSYFENEWVHLLLLVLIIPIAVFAFSKGKSIHKKSTPLYLGLAGVVFLFSALFFESFFETLLTAVGCLFLISGHLLNAKYLYR